MSDEPRSAHTNDTIFIRSTSGVMTIERQGIDVRLNCWDSGGHTGFWLHDEDSIADMRDVFQAALDELARLRKEHPQSYPTP